MSDAVRRCYRVVGYDSVGSEHVLRPYVDAEDANAIANRLWRMVTGGAAGATEEYLADGTVRSVEIGRIVSIKVVPIEL